MKFYYDGQLIRTSKTHEYKFACVRLAEDGRYKNLGCSATYKGACKERDSRVSGYRSNEAFCKVCADAVRNGKTFVWNKVCGRSYRHMLDRTAEEYDRLAKESAELANYYETAYKIVELEMVG